MSMTDTLADLDGDGARAPAPTGLRTTRPIVAVEALLLLAFAAIGLYGYRPVFNSWHTFVGPAYGALFASSVLAAVMAQRRIPTRLSFLLSFVAGGIFLCYTVLVSVLAGGVVPGRRSLDQLAHGIGHGWQSMLSQSLPLANTTDALVWLVALAWLVGHLTTELARRTRFVALPLVPPLVMFGLSLPLTASTAEPSAALVGALIGTALLAILVRAVPDPNANRPAAGAARYGVTEFHSRSVLGARLSLGLPIILVCVVAGPFLAAVLDNRSAFDPRDLRSDVISTNRYADPLAELKAMIARTKPAFRVAFPSDKDALDVQRVGIVSLDQYDGARWSSTNRYQDAGPVLVSPTAKPPGRVIHQSYTIADIDDPWLPAAGEPDRVDLHSVGYDPRSGDLLGIGNIKGITYQVDSHVEVPSAEELAVAVPDRNADAAPYVALPGGIPASIKQTAAEATAGASSPADMLARLDDYLRSNYAYSDKAPSGQSYGRLGRFLTAPKNDADHSGTAEQFASAFAVMARSLGFPTRVVVGYRVVQDVAGKVTPIQFVTSANYHAWDEVRFEGLGWVAFDPTPKAGDTPDQPAEQPAPVTTLVPVNTGAQQPAPHVAGPSEGLTEHPSSSDALMRAGVYTAAGVGALLVVLGAIGAVIVLLKHRRRRRRLAAPRAADRVVGAWEEVIDRLHEMQFPMSQSMTALDIARATRVAYGTAATMPLAYLVPDVGRAIYSRDEPSPDVIDRAWTRTAEFEQNLADSLTRRQRWRARFSIRPLRVKP